MCTLFKIVGSVGMGFVAFWVMSMAKLAGNVAYAGTGFSLTWGFVAAVGAMLSSMYTFSVK